jgi:DNA mismatch endonuclease (patch repair protein)
MKRQRQRDTAPELALRSLLHRRGLRFRVNYPIPGLRRRADLAFTKTRVAVFVDGCFWHGCPEHGTWPKENADWWRGKIEGNRERDRDTDRRLADAGWVSVRVWEHEDVRSAAQNVAEVVEGRREPIGSWMPQRVRGMA